MVRKEGRRKITGLKNVSHVNAGEEKKGGMRIIDSDDPSRMAVFPKGEMVSGSQLESLSWGGEEGQRSGGGESISSCFTFKNRTHSVV